jgi:sugar/nucleoside kinase (ribokinase family)
LGGSTEFWGRVGDDEPGHAVLKELKSFNVNTSQVHVVQMEKLAVCFVMVKADSGDRAFVVSAQKESVCGPQESTPWTEFEKRKQCSLMLRGLKRLSKAAHCARSHGVPVVADVHDPSQPSLDLLSLADYAIIPKHLAEVLTTKGDYARALHDLKARGTKYRSLRSVRKAAPICIRKSFQVARVPRESCRHDGAGDCFHGAFCFALSRGFALPKQLVWLQRVAAISCTKLGGRSGIPTYEETLAFMREQAARA